MDDEEKRALFRGLIARHPTINNDDDQSSLGSDDDSVCSQDPAASVPQPLCNESAALSDAETIEPDEIPPNLPCASPPSRASIVTSHSVSIKSPSQAPYPNPVSPSVHSASSSAETVPPPSPAALTRYYASASPTAAVRASNSRGAHTSRAVVVDIDERGIDGWEADLHNEDLILNNRRNKLGGQYPKLSATQFKFRQDLDSVDNHLQLSNRKGALQAPSSTIGVLPASILRFLSPYQKDGVTFMYRLFERDRGGLLADAMGLGKTVQAVCFLGAAFGIWDRDLRNESAPIPEPPPRILVVAPTSVRENWRREFNRWTPFRVKLYDRAAEPEISRALREGSIDVLISGDNPVAVHGKHFFSNPTGGGKIWKWDVIIVDEIHVAKNANTKIFSSLKAIPKTAMFGLTGTAVQNRLKELWNVMSLVVPSTLWPSYKSFRADYIDIINIGSKKDASKYMREKAAQRISRLRVLLAKHMVRRPKCVIESQLPGKTDYCVLMRMKRRGLQGYMYQKFQNSYDVRLLRDAKLPCDCGSRVLSKECCHRYPVTKENLAHAPIWKMHHKGKGPCERCPNCICLYLQHYSRCLAAHALLLMPEENEPDREKAEARKKLFKYYLGEHANKALGPVTLLEQEADISCKLNVALRLLKSFESSGHKTIIFYESLRLGAILQRWATNKGLVYEVIDGSVTNGHRQGAVDRFNSNSVCSIFFISKKAGGTGLNICGADRVLIFEPCWNPTLDLQAGDRAHRLGQKRVVHIIRLVVENTIEHYVFKTAISKSQVSSAILDNTKEEWRIREDEVGSMQAMLSMGDVFAAHESQPDEFRVVEARKLDEQRIQKRESQSFSAKTEELDEEADSLKQDSPSQLDILGDDVVCSLDVEDEDDQKEAENGFVSLASQFETDVLVEAGVESSKVVMSSTSSRKRKNQMMGVSTKQTSGINAHGPDNLDFDNAALKEMPLSMENEGLEEGMGEGNKRTNVNRIFSSRSTERRRKAQEDIKPLPPLAPKRKTVAKKKIHAASLECTDEEDEDVPAPKRKCLQTKRLVVSRQSTTEDGEKKGTGRVKSAFAKRARVRR